MKNSTNVSNDKGPSHNSSCNPTRLSSFKDNQVNSTNSFNRSRLIDKMNYFPQTTKFKSFFDREGNPFKYFMDIKKHLKSNSNSLVQYLIK